MKKKKIKVPHIATILNYVILLAISLVFLLPFLYVVSMSFASDASYGKYGATLIPKEWSLAAYRYMFEYGTALFQAFSVTLFVTAAGTVCSLSVTTLLSYGLSRRDVPYRKFFMTMVIITMFFNGGMIPQYLLVRSLGLLDTLAVMFVPSLVYSWNMIIMRNYFMSFPDSLMEAAKCDGAGEARVFFSIVLPASKAIIATITLFCLVGYWNSWFPAALYISDSTKWPVMLFLKNMLYNFSSVANMINPTGMVTSNPPTEALKMACVVVVALPIIISYPFAQKYFVKGVMLGSLKG